MENDSLNTEAALNDSANVAPDSVPASSINMPTPEQLGISVKAGPEGGMPAVTVGDTFDFPVTVSWRARSVKDGAEVASITFTYKILAQDTGNLHIPALRFEIPTQMGQPLDLRSESVDVRVNEPFNPLPLVVGLVVAVCVLCAGLWRAKRRAAARTAAAAKNAAERALRERMLVLKQRVSPPPRSTSTSS